jgi:hypothetical protein
MIIYNENEYWVPIKGFENTHMLSNLGRVKSLARTWISGGSYQIIRTKPECELKQTKYRGYYGVTLIKNGIPKVCLVHRLLGEHFILNPNNYPVINHLNGVKTDNSLKNIEWTTTQGNTIHAYKIGLAKGKKLGDHSGAKKIKCETLDIEFTSAIEAAQALNVHYESVLKVAKGYKKHIKGFSFRYL